MKVNQSPVTTGLLKTRSILVYSNKLVRDIAIFKFVIKLFVYFQSIS